MKLVPVSDVDFDKFVRAFNRAFANYFVKLVMNKQSMLMLAETDAVDFAASVAACKDDQIIGTALLAQRGENGWIGGVGVVPAFRQQGVATAMMHYLIARARERQITNVVLEVIEQNTTAMNLYKQLGFVSKRRLVVLERKAAAIPFTESSYDLRAITPHDVLALFDTYHAIPNPWQRGLKKLKKSTMGFDTWALTPKNMPEQILAYCIAYVGYDYFHIFDIGIDKTISDQESIFFELFISIHEALPDYGARFVNQVEQHPATSVLFQLGYQETLAQHEMVLTL